MTFVVPLFLFAALAGIIPVVLHMINRQRAKDLPFPTLRFLRISVQKTRRRRRIQDVFLMLLRVAAMLLIAVGLSKPTVTNLQNLFGGGSNSAVAIVLDNSESMGTTDSDHQRIESALAATEQILAEVKDGDQVALFITNGPSFPELGKLDRNQEKIRQILAQCKVSYELANAGVRLDEARHLLSKSDQLNKQLFVISDFQTLSFDTVKRDAEKNRAAGNDPEPPPASLTKEERALRELPIVLLDLNRNPKPNIAVQAVKLEAAMPIAGLPIKAVPTLFNASTVSQNCRAELWLDGVKEVQSPELTIGPKETLRTEFVFRFKTGGLHKGEIRLAGNDGNPLDNRRFFTMEIDQGIPVGIVKNQRHEIPYLEDTYYVEKAMSGGKGGSWAIKAQGLTAAQLANEPLNHFKVLYCVNLPAPDETAAAKLRAYVEQGGNLFWICGDNVEPEPYNQMNAAAGGALLPAPLIDVRSPEPGAAHDFWKVGGLDKEYPPLATLIEPPSLYQSVLVYKYLRIDQAKAGNALKALARLEDGELILSQRKVGKGTVTLLGTSGHVNWTNLPVRPIFLPMLAQMTFYLSGTEQVRRESVAGAPIVINFTDEIRPSVIEISPPSGETIRRNLAGEKLPPDQPFQYTDTGEIGYYLFRLLQGVAPKLVPFSVNVDPEEASPEKILCIDFETAYPNPFIFAGFADDKTAQRGKMVGDLKEAYDWMRQGKSLWGTFLTILLIVLICETFVSNIFSPKKEEDASLQNVPVGMRRLAQKGKQEAVTGVAPAK